MNLTDIRDAIAPGLLQTLEEVPFDVTYVFPAKDFGNANFVEDIQTPPGFRGKVRGINLYDVTETFNADTTPARVDIGTGADADAFVISSSIGLLASGAALALALTDGVTVIIPENSQVEVAGVAPTGGVETGIATVAVTIQYFK
jgi:hypothetical protein